MHRRLMEEAGLRRQQMLMSAFGTTIEAALVCPSIIEVMVNPDGCLWFDKTGEGRIKTSVVLDEPARERIIRLVASSTRGEVHERAPIVSAELPESGERFEGLLPPVALAPCFTIRKPAGMIYRLGDYVDAQIMLPKQAEALFEAVIDCKNIVVVGGTSSGKTTLVNALLAEVAETDDRVIILEDTRELNCAAKDVVSLRTKPDVADLGDLVRSTMRLRPDRIIVGEVRGPEALDMLKAWNTGHPGGITTIHANSDRAGLYRLEQLIQEAVVSVPRRLITEAVDILVFIEGRDAARKVRTISKVTGLDGNGDYQLDPLAPIHLNSV